MNTQTTQTLKGFRDLLPEEKRQKMFLVNKIIETFTLFGFEPLETPTLEYAELLLGKYGEEADKLVYTFADKGGREVGLRYDQTVPTARILAQFRNNLPKYFRRYQIQNVFRADKPQQGRFREFTQCDIDIFGTTSTLADAEILACTYSVYKNIGFEKVKLEVNNRQLLINALKPFTDSKVDVFSIIQSIDKSDKKPQEMIEQELQEKGLSQEATKKIFTTLSEIKPDETLNKIIEQAAALGVNKEDLVFTPTLARGLDYYTGLIFEIKLPDYEVGSCGGGGRYDNLIGDLCSIQIPAVGVGIGFDRTLEAAVQLGLVPETKAPCRVLVTIFSEEAVATSLETAQMLRKNKIDTIVYPEEDKIGKQLKYANQQQIPWVIIIGDEELAKNKISLKNMISGDQQQLSFQEATKLIVKNNTSGTE